MSKYQDPTNHYAFKKLFQDETRLISTMPSSSKTKVFADLPCVHTTSFVRGESKEIPANLTISRMTRDRGGLGRTFIQIPTMPSSSKTHVFGDLPCVHTTSFVHGESKEIPANLAISRMTQDRGKY